MRKWRRAFLFLFALLLIGCSKEQAFVDINEALDIDVAVGEKIKVEKVVFTNTQTNQPVEIIHYLDNTDFRFYNSVSFNDSNSGVLVGGTRLSVSITDDGGQTWQEYKFSKFANAFHDVGFANDKVFIVGESKFIFMTPDLGKSWRVFDSGGLLGEHTSLSPIKYYKIKFFNAKVGFIAGERDGRPILLKTVNGGVNWQAVNTQTLANGGITDLALLAEQTLLAVTYSGQLYKTPDQGQTWQLLYENKGISLNAIDFKNDRLGFIGGLNNQLLQTNDGGKNWHEIDLSLGADDSNISDIVFLEEQVLFTTAVSFYEEEREAFVYTMNTEGSNIRPFLSKMDGAVFFVGDSYKIKVLDNRVYILDRNNLYRMQLDNSN